MDEKRNESDQCQYSGDNIKNIACADKRYQEKAGQKSAANAANSGDGIQIANNPPGAAYIFNL